MKFVVDFDDSEDLHATIGLMTFVEKMGICRFNQLSNFEHWFSDIMIVEYGTRDAE